MFACGRAVRRRRAKQAAWNDSGTEEQGSEQGMEWSPAVGAFNSRAKTVRRRRRGQGGQK